MSTRGAYGYRIDGKDKIGYNHFDSYPAYLGIKIMEFIKETPDDKLKEFAKNLRLVNNDIPITTKDIQEYNKYCNLEVNDGDLSWYSLLREAQGDLSAPATEDSADFLEDSLFCEWAYIVNIDTGKLEIYRGHNQEPSANHGRYANIEYDNGYYGVKLIKEIPFDEIRKLNDTQMEELAEKLEKEN